MKEALIIFVRHPELGKVKTRLAKTVGDENALDIYRQLLQHTHAVTFDLPCDKYVYYADSIPEQDLWENESYYKSTQHGSTLGERMLHAFTEVFSKGYTAVQIIGSDCATLTTTIVQQGFSSLAKNDIVIGPSKDGGYYLLGMQKSHAKIFTNKVWSTDTVLQQTIDDIQQLSLSHTLLPILTDIDTEADWIAYQKTIPLLTKK